MHRIGFAGWLTYRPPFARAVVAVLAIVLVVAGCASGPPPTPTLPPALDFTVTPLFRTPTPSVTPIPSLTPSRTATAVPPTATIQPTARQQAVTDTPLPATATRSVAVVPSIPPPLPGLPPVAVTVPAGAPSYIFPGVQSGTAIQLEQPVNADFDEGGFQQGAPEIIVPVGWQAWWRTGPVDCARYTQLQTTGPCPALQDANLTYKRPEFSVVPASGAWLDPPRVAGAGQAARFFCTYGICEGGYLQQVSVIPGERYALSALAHAWCTQNTADPYHSQLDTRDDRLNCEVAVGIDPKGGTDPWSSDVIWQAAYLYDVYGELVSPAVQASGPVMTLFLRGRSLWALRHNDFHFDRVTFARFMG